MADDKGSQDAAMARAKAQVDQMKAQEQGKQGVSQDNQQVSAPLPKPNQQEQAKSDRAIDQGKTLESNSAEQTPQWKDKNQAPASEQVRAEGQTLQQSGVKLESPPLSQEKAAHLQNTLDNSTQTSGSKPSKSQSIESSVREEAKGAETSKTSEPEMGMDK